MAITTHNLRYQMTIDCFAQIIDNDFIAEFVIVDDASPDNAGIRLIEYFKNNPKVKIYINEENIQMSRNKNKAIGLCKEPFVLIGDSDNTFTNYYIDALKNILLEDNTIYCPDFAKPTFNFKKFSGRTFDKTNIKELAFDDMGNVSMNTCNYVVPKERYLRVYEHNPLMKATDTVHFAYLWLKAGNKFHIVDGMEYEHLVHKNSGFMDDCDYNMARSAELRKKIIEL